jgi:hypothetical protein
MVEDLCFALPLPEPVPVGLDLRSRLLQPTPVNFSDNRVGLFCGGVIEYSVPPASGLIDLFGSTDDFESALAAGRIILVELGSAASPWISGEEIAETAMEVSPVDAAILRAALTYDATYNWLQEPDDGPQYGMRVRFVGASKTIALDLCLPCRTARRTRADVETLAANFEFGFPNVAAVIARYFPRAVERLDL